MSKKKHQGDPNADESTESGDENDNMTECRHINKAVDLQRVKKALVRTGFSNDCEQCLQMKKEVVEEMEAEFEFENSLWLCLRCGNQSCGRMRNKHALQHFETPHSDSHAICVDTASWSVWCYDCDEVVNVTAKKKLLEAVEYLQKQTENKIVQSKPIALGYTVCLFNSLISFSHMIINFMSQQNLCIYLIMTGYRVVGRSLLSLS